MIFIIDDYYLVISLLIGLGWQCCFFIGASTLKSDKVTDFAYGTNFVGLAVILFACSGVYTARNIIVLVFIIVWGLRLALYLFARVIKEGKDARFDDKRDDFFKFLAFWVLQWLTVWIISIPFMFLFSRFNYNPSALGWRDGLGIALFVIGFVVETVADQQKFAFKNEPENRKKMCTVGLWKYSRHPNYFGETLVWFGIFSMCSSVFDLEPALYASILSPFYVWVILMFLSGIPTLEGPWDQKYGKDEDYREYKRSTTPFVLFLPALYKKFPKGLKLLFCCEFPFYSTNFPPDGFDVEPSLESAFEDNAHPILPSYQQGGSTDNKK